MYEGRTVFAQLMDFVPRHTFRRRVKRYGGDDGVRRFTCWQQFLAMSLAQLTFRESLRDNEVCLAAVPDKIYHMGFNGPVRRSTLSDANETRDWRIYFELAQALIAEARKLYADEPIVADLRRTVYALDSTTIDLCLSIFPWATFRSTKAAVKVHTLLDLRGSIPSFVLITPGRVHDVNALDELIPEPNAIYVMDLNALDELIPEPNAIYVMDRAYVDFERLARLHEARAVFVTRAKKGLGLRRLYSAPTDRAAGIISDQTVKLTGRATVARYTEKIRRIRYRDPETLVSR